MIRGKSLKSLTFGSLALVLALGLAFGCAPAAAPGEEVAELEEEIADLEDEVAAKDKEIASLEDEIAALKKPAEVYHWAPATWIGSGPLFDALVHFGEFLEKGSDGRFEVTPSAPGAICPVDEQAEAVSGGLTPIMVPAGTYYGGKIPITNVYGVGVGLPDYRDFVMAFQIFKDGSAMQLLKEAYEEEFNLVFVWELIGPQNILLGSNKPIDSIADLDGQKLRCGDEAIAGPLTEFGTSTTWIPAPEVYTALATGVFDGFTMGSAADDYALSFHEVTQYWLKSPNLMVLYEMPFLVNRDVWNEMPGDLQEMVKVAAIAADSICQWETELGTLDAWAAVIDTGIIPVTWSEADTNQYMEAQTRWAEKIAEEDWRTAELLEITREYREYAGL